MNIAYTNSYLDSEGLKITFTDIDGNSIRPNSVKYTVFDSSNNQVSGVSLPAAYKDNGFFYAPWKTSMSPGVYFVRWEITTDVSYSFIKELLYLVQSGSKPVASPGNKVFPKGFVTTRNDLPIFFRTPDGTLQDPYYIVSYISTVQGCLLTDRKFPNRFDIGEYYISTTLNMKPGIYLAVFEYSETEQTPLVRVSNEFIVVNESVQGGGL